ncbi:MAG: phospho-sugar mutase [Deltaproteobacteria bacterium]|nr:phospho-sugar mutase [Deltaproteobacteria bacterium]
MAQDLDSARTFLAQDIDAEGRLELEELLKQVESGDAEAAVELEDAFAGTLAFGTAGLRGRVGPGTNRMNRVVVMRATWGLGKYLLEQFGDDDKSASPKSRGVVIGFDGRRTSRQFAEDAAAVLCAQGIPAWLFDDITSTPTCAFAVTHLGAAAGIMVTASHNPPLDNGYKVYWENGAQIIPPHDKGIATCIERAPAANAMPRMHAFEAAQEKLRKTVHDDVTKAYLAGVDAGRFLKDVPREPLHVVYTAMHGVGHPLVVRALRTAGFDGVSVVPSQTEADGAFPTVAFPNPEEDGALDRSLAIAKEVNAELIVANDPDADRLAVVVRNAQGDFIPLSGNEIGALLGHAALKYAEVGDAKKLVITTLVSSTLLSRMAADHDAEYRETLTGFKWIANTALDEKPAGNTFVFGYEEALGYSVGELVRDKDGVSAIVHLVELAAVLKKEGKTLLDELEEIFVAHGLSVSLQWSKVLPGKDGKAQIAALLETLRSEGMQQLGESDVVKSADLSTNICKNKGAQDSVVGFPSSNVLVFTSEDGTRLTVRPSGTEPKIKFYLEMVKHVAERAALKEARNVLGEKCDGIRAQLENRLF